MDGNLTGAEVEAVFHAGSRFGESRDNVTEAVEAEELLRRRSFGGKSEGGTSQEQPLEEAPREWSQERHSQGNEALEVGWKVEPRKGNHRKTGRKSGA